MFENILKNLQYEIDNVSVSKDIEILALNTADALHHVKEALEFLYNQIPH